MHRQTDLEQEESVCAQHRETDTRGKTSDAQSPLVLQRRRDDRQSDGQKTPSHRLRRNWGLGLSEQEGKTRESRGSGARLHGRSAVPSFPHPRVPPAPARPERQPEPG